MFQEFHPMGGVDASGLEGTGMGNLDVIVISLFYSNFRNYL